ncbi:hypothetical protein [Actinacidiphila reveromycinica]|nr:hypothetical protein [Streptomyces sp. SN-593]
MSTVPAALAALVDTFNTAPGLADVTVFDGPVATNAAPMAALTVGYGLDDDPTGVSGSTDRPGLSASPSEEAYTVTCVASVLDGGGSVPAARGRVFAIYAEVGAALAADPRLGGAVMQAQPGSVSLTQEQGNAGALVSLSFGIDVVAFTRR